MELYKKCDNVKCEWHMGFGHDNHTYLNGACYHHNNIKNMFCPLNKNSPLLKNKSKKSDKTF